MEDRDVVAGRAGLKGITGIGIGDIPDRGIGYQLNVISIIMAQNIHSAHALPGQRLAAPLGEAVAGDGGAIAELGGKGLHKAFAADVGGEQVIH